MSAPPSAKLMKALVSSSTRSALPATAITSLAPAPAASRPELRHQPLDRGAIAAQREREPVEIDQSRGVRGERVVAELGGQARHGLLALEPRELILHRREIERLLHAAVLTRCRSGA